MGSTLLRARLTHHHPCIAPTLSAVHAIPGAACSVRELQVDASVLDASLPLSSATLTTGN